MWSDTHELVSPESGREVLLQNRAHLFGVSLGYCGFFCLASSEASSYVGTMIPVSPIGCIISKQCFFNRDELTPAEELATVALSEGFIGFSGAAADRSLAKSVIAPVIPHSDAVFHSAPI